MKEKKIYSTVFLCASLIALVLFVAAFIFYNDFQVFPSSFFHSFPSYEEWMKIIETETTPAQDNFFMVASILKWLLMVILTYGIFWTGRQNGVSNFLCACVFAIGAIAMFGSTGSNAFVCAAFIICCAVEVYAGGNWKESKVRKTVTTLAIGTLIHLITFLSYRYLSDAYYIYMDLTFPAIEAVVQICLLLITIDMKNMDKRNC